MIALTEPVRYVIDASVITKWHLQDEQDSAAADALLTDFREGYVALLAPDHLRYEVASAIRNAVRTERVTNLQARQAIADVLSWRIPTVSHDELILSAFDYATWIGCSLYDGLYLALADSAACPFIYADGRLRNAMAGRFARALWLGDYSPRFSY